MHYEMMGKVIDRWMQDATFRAAMRKDPEGAVRGAHIPLTGEEFAILRKVDWNLSDEELKARVTAAA